MGRPLLARAAVPVFIVTTVLSSLPAAASERWATLEAIHQLENPSNSAAPGALGELGPYQFREATWRMHTNAPFSRALDRRSADAVAVKHYDWISSELERVGAPVTPYNVALAWNAGLRAVTSEHPPGVAIDYATRAANLAGAFLRSESAYSR
ncbi:MAG TPA: hypothetical protein VGG34_07825 [Opitutaceae bacterium]|jgi:hypothetical protein